MKYESVRKVLGKVIVYGGHGALGVTCIKYLKKKDWWVANVDFSPNKIASFNVVVPHVSWRDQEDFVVKNLETELDKEKVNAIICLSNGSEKGNASSGLSKQVELMTRKCIWGSTICTTIATKYLNPGGLFVLYGSIQALSGTPEMIGHGMVNAAVHHLTKSLANPYSGLPKKSTVVAILPETLDTEENRKWKPVADFNNFTPVIVVAETLEKWITGERPPTGSLICIVTRNKQTTLMRVLPDLQNIESECC